MSQSYRGPERRQSQDYTSHELDMRYVMRFGDEFQTMSGDVKTLRREMDEVVGTGKRLERAINGGYNEKDEYVTGLRDQTRWLRPLAIGIWALVLALVPVVVNNILHLIHTGGKQ